jgi:hypothetical protein
MELQQKNLEEFISRRRNILNNLRNISNRAAKEEDLLNKIKLSKMEDRD